MPVVCISFCVKNSNTGMVSEMQALATVPRLYAAGDRFVFLEGVDGWPVSCGRLFLIAFALETCHG